MNFKKVNLDMNEIRCINCGSTMDLMSEYKEEQMAEGIFECDNCGIAVEVKWGNS